MFIYVRDRVRDLTYHWCLDCPQYPGNSFTQSTMHRPTEHLCATCTAIERDDTGVTG
ncbi:MAG: hypothetical protein QOI61_849 [Actinomycetota bacterium]